MQKPSDSIAAAESNSNTRTQEMHTGRNVLSFSKTCNKQNKKRRKKPESLYWWVSQPLYNKIKGFKLHPAGKYCFFFSYLPRLHRLPNCSYNYIQLLHASTLNNIGYIEAFGKLDRNWNFFVQPHFLVLLQLDFTGSVPACTDFQGNQLTHFWLSAFHSTTVASFTKATVCILKVQKLLRPNYVNLQ